MFPPCGPEVLAVCPAILPGRVQHWRAIYLVLRWLRLLEVQLLPWRSQNPAGNQFLVRKFLGILVVHICVAGHGNIDNSLVLSKNTINICWHSRRLTIIGFYQRRRRRTGFLYLACRLCAPGGRHPAGGRRCAGTDSSSCPCPAAAFGCCLLWRTPHVFGGLWAGGLELCEVLCCSPLLDGAKWHRFYWKDFSMT